ncbi:MAG: 3'-5' exonuclease [Planctomycetota bacterium]|nr:3'-5' exonuclease [Planctomycetota bacterium]MDG1985182.1 3'-5' exonuclease [Planctomycetota bacterium]
MSRILEGLNPEQRAAVTQTSGPVLVLAGAGTGKTRVITVRIAHLIDKGVLPEKVLAMTFTNKAAAEMRERLGKLVGKKKASTVIASTFHSFCLRTLREYAAEIGYPEGFTIADSSDQLSILKLSLRELHIPEARMKVQEIQSKISLAKNRLDTPESFLARAGDSKHELVGRVWEKYRDILRRSRRLDFDDLLTETLRLLREKKAVRLELQGRHRYLLVDEYQDTNGVQFEIVCQLTGPEKHLCVVGDDDQSIYGWRGADVSKILGFERSFPGAKVVKLETNYRSTAQILGAANRVIKNNPNRHDKALRSALGDGEPLMAVTMRDESVEAEKVVAEIKHLVSQGHSYSDFAILFRTAVQPRPFEAELRMKEVPYVLVGGMSFFDRKEVRDVLAYLRVVANPRDEASLLRIVNSPPRGVGKTTLDRVLEFATQEGISVAEAFDRAQEIPKINMRAVEAVQGLRARLREVHRLHPKGEDLVELARRVVEEVAYRDEVRRLYPEEADFEKRWAAVEEVFNFAENYISRRKRPGLLGFLNELSLSASDTDSAEDAARRQAVTLMTLHSSKGLEYPRVYLVGLEEGVLPHQRAAAEDGVEEERRLAYVGITRAQRALTLSWCAERARGGQKVARHPSRFLLEVQGKAPPEGWIPAGDGDPTGLKAAKKRRRRRRARR